MVDAVELLQELAVVVHEEGLHVSLLLNAIDVSGDVVVDAPELRTLARAFGSDRTVRAFSLKLLGNVDFLELVSPVSGVSLHQKMLQFVFAKTLFHF